LVSDLSAKQLARVDGLLDELLICRSNRDCPCSTASARTIRLCTRSPQPVECGEGSGGLSVHPAMLVTEPLLEDIPPGTRIGAWRITRRIGRGGMGVVYEAERAEGDFQQRVAVSCYGRNR